MRSIKLQNRHFLLVLFSSCSLCGSHFFLFVGFAFVFISLSLCENFGVGGGQETVLYHLFVFFLTVGGSIGQTRTDGLTDICHAQQLTSVLPASSSASEFRGSSALE